MALAGAAHALGEDVHLFCDERAVALPDRRRADELAARDVGDAGLGDADDDHVVGDLDLHRFAVSCLDREHVAVDGLERAADTGRSVGGRLREGGSASADECECCERPDHVGSLCGGAH